MSEAAQYGKPDGPNWITPTSIGNFNMIRENTPIRDDGRLQAELGAESFPLSYLFFKYSTRSSPSSVEAGVTTESRLW